MLDTAKMKTLREQRGLSQTEAAKLAGLSVQKWNNIERGLIGTKQGITLGTLEKVARALGVKAKDLLR